MAVLKGIAAHYVMQAEDRVPIQVRQRELLAELVALLAHRGPAALERPFVGRLGGRRPTTGPGSGW